MKKETEIKNETVDTVDTVEGVAYLPKFTIAPGLGKYDKYLCIVERPFDPELGDYSTRSVSLSRKLGSNIVIGQETADFLNYQQDHRNNTALGTPLVTLLFAEGTAQIGDIFAAEDIWSKGRNKVIKGLKVLFDKKLN